MAHALPAPPVATATTFSALFNDASKDPFIVNGTYDDYLWSFNIVPGTPPDTPDAVRQRIAAAANQHLPIALLLFVNGILRPYFLPFHRDQAMGIAAHAATDNKLFAYDGELIQGQGSLVEFPNQWFSLAPQITVATVANIGGLLAADAALTSVGPFAPGDPDTVDIRTRFTVAIPNKYAGLFLSQPDGVTPRYYFETIHPVIAADDPLLPSSNYDCCCRGELSGGRSYANPAGWTCASPHSCRRHSSPSPTCPDYRRWGGDQLDPPSQHHCGRPTATCSRTRPGSGR